MTTTLLAWIYLDYDGPSPCDGACGVTPHAAESGGGPYASGGSGRASQSAQLCQRTTARPHHRTSGARDTAPLLTKGGRKRPSDEGWRLRPARPAAESQQDECHMDAQRQCYGTCDVRPSEGDVAARVPGTGRPAHSTTARRLLAADVSAGYAPGRVLMSVSRVLPASLGSRC